MQKKYKKITLACFAGLAAVITGCGENSVNKPGAFPPAAVDYTIAQKANVPVVSHLTGRTTAVRTAEVRPQVSGVLLQKLFIEGSEVKAGQQLYQIDPSMYEAQLASAKAELARAEANVYTAKMRYERYKQLRETNAISQQEFDDSFANFKAAEASVLAAKAAVKTAEINVAYTKVYAPISGIISRSNVTEGALVTTGQAQQLATIQQLNPMYIDLGQTVVEHLELKNNQLKGVFSKGENNEVTLFLENGQEYEHKGKLGFSEVSVDASTGMVTVRVEAPNPENMLLPGMYIKADINQGIQNDAVLIPQVAVLRQNNGTSIVYTVSEQNCPPNVKECVALNVVNLAGEYKNFYIVKSGIKAGDKIITSNIQKIGPGAPITPIESKQ